MKDVELDEGWYIFRTANATNTMHVYQLCHHKGGEIVMAKDTKYRVVSYYAWREVLDALHEQPKLYFTAIMTKMFETNRISLVQKLLRHIWSVEAILKEMDTQDTCVRILETPKMAHRLLKLKIFTVEIEGCVLTVSV